MSESMTAGVTSSGLGGSLPCRFWPPPSLLVPQGTMFLLGLFTGALAVADGRFLVVAVSCAMVAFAVLTFGWVDIEPGVVSQQKVGRKRVAVAGDVIQVDLVSIHSKGFSWWFPVLELQNGKRVRLSTLASLSRKNATTKAGIIEAALRDDTSSVTPGELATERAPA